MPVGFYEILQVPPDAPVESIRTAYQDQVASVVRKLRAAEARQQDVAAIEARRAALGEAWSVLSDPARRRRYDRFRELSKGALPADPDELWSAAGRSLVDPAAAAALEVVRTLTDLRVGEALGVTSTTTADPEVSPVSVREASPASERTLVSRRAEPRPSIPTAPALPLDRTLSPEEVARLPERYGPTGAYLRAVREARRIDLDALSASTRITRRFLDALERDAYAELPGATFVRGYLKMVVRALESLDGPELDEFVEGYMSRFHRARG